MAGIGSVQNGRYEMLGVISQGGLSTVYMAVDRANNRTWAVKEIQTTSASGGEGQRVTALMESMIMAKLSHASIPIIEEVFEAGDALYIVMEYMAGRTLENMVRVFGPMNRISTIRIGVQLCKVLDYLHTLPAPVIFCDLKPSNVMLTDREMPAVKLFDFGAARVYEENEDARTERFGTKGFTAPELISGGRQVDIRADIFSLGATLSFLLTGEEPGEDRDSEAGFNGKGTGRLEAILRRCLQSEPEGRYADCVEVRTDLEKCLVAEIASESQKVESRRGEGIPKTSVDRTVRLGVTTAFREGIIGQEQLSGIAKQMIGFRSDIKILLCDAAEWL